MKKVSIRVDSAPYDAIVGPDLLAQSGTLVRHILPPGKCAVITDSNVARHFASAVTASFSAAKFQPLLVTLPAGERSKSLGQVENICDQLAEANFDRSSFVVALGGGVIGDLAGFVAAVFHRGIPVVQIPTTLLAQVDSSIGGKTAVNSGTENLIGAIHHPVLVISDTSTLATLPTREFNQGFAEIIKHAVIRDADMFAEIEKFQRGDDLDALVRRNIAIKAEFVAADEKDETGTRALLNFGHTIGHAVERAGNYETLLHGEAVSIGIAAACELSVRKANFPSAARDKVLAALRQFDLPTKLPANISREEVLRAISFDKKFERGEVRFVVATKLGSARLTSDITMRDLEEIVQNL